MSRIKTHWQKSHPVAWRYVSSTIEGDMASLQSTLRRPCQYCGSSAADLGAHSRQCSTLFQLLAVRSLHRLGRLQHVRDINSGISKRQEKDNPAYASYKIEHSPIGQALGLSKKAAADRPLDKAMAKSTVTWERSSGTGGRGDANGARVWTLRLVLHNPGNHCYANAGITSMSHAFTMARSTPPSLRPLLEYLRSQAQFGIRVTLHACPSLRGVSGYWTYNSEQQDAAEYTGVVLDSAGVMTRTWCSRKNDDGIVVTTDHGIAVLLEMPTHGVDLQALIDEWQHQTHTHALSEQSVLVSVQIGRYRRGRKNQARLSFIDDVAVPVFADGLNCLRAIYRPVAAIVHLGPTCRSGHNRSLLRCGDHWYYTDDSRCAVRCSLEHEHFANVCYIWLARPHSLPFSGRNA